MLSVDKSGDPAALLDFRYHVERDRCLTTGLRSVDLNDTSFRKAAKSEGDIKA